MFKSLAEKLATPAEGMRASIERLEGLNNQAQRLGFMSIHHALDCLARVRPSFTREGDGSWTMHRTVSLANTYPPEGPKPGDITYVSTKDLARKEPPVTGVNDEISEDVDFVTVRVSADKFPPPPETCADAAARLPGIGDQVQLKSGGPSMTVVYSDLSEIGVSWFDRDVNLCCEDFPPESLEPFSDEKFSF